MVSISIFASILLGAGVKNDPLDLLVEEAFGSGPHRLVAVEFFASWCPPCVAAVPKWKDLQTYGRRHGLEVVVVATQDEEGGCDHPGWRPDRVVCDRDGRIARSFGADRRLPAAFLWSWNGQLLVDNGHVDEIRAAAEAYFRDSPRVLVEAEGDQGEDPRLGDAVREALVAQSRLMVVATAPEQARLRKMMADSLQARYDDRLHCEVGQSVPPNTLLKVKRAPHRIRMLLMSAESGCLVASASAPRGRDIDESARHGVQALVSRLKRPFVRPRAAPSVQTVQTVQTVLPPPAFSMPTSLLIANFVSRPAGATVFVDDLPVCTPTPCSATVDPGQHEVRFELSGYETERVRARLSPDSLSVTVDLSARPSPEETPVDPDERKVSKVMRWSSRSRRVVQMVVARLDVDGVNPGRSAVARADRALEEAIRSLGYAYVRPSDRFLADVMVDTFPEGLACAASCRASIAQQYPDAWIVVPTIHRDSDQDRCVLSLRLYLDGESAGTTVGIAMGQLETLLVRSTRTALLGLVERHTPRATAR